jgi:hypothetical protein
MQAPLFYSIELHWKKALKTDPKGDTFCNPHNVARKQFKYTRVEFDRLVKLR